MAINYVSPQDGNNNPMGLNFTKMYLAETMMDGIVIPGVTVSQVRFTKQGKAFYHELTGEAKTSELCASSRATNTNTILREIVIDKKISFDFAGCYLSNITDIEHDRALYELSKESMGAQLEENLLTLLDTSNTPTTATATLTADNVLTQILAAKEEYRRDTKKRPNVIIADYSIETIIKSNALVASNNVTASLQTNADMYDGMVIVYADLSAYTAKFFMYSYERVVQAFVNPDENSIIPGLSEEVVDGAIIRRTELNNEINRISTLHLPFGNSVLNPLYVRAYIEAV